MTAEGRSIVVMKFGGTSVAEPQGRRAITARVASARAEGIDPVVVVSAMGRSPEPYATDTLLSLVDPAHLTPHERDLLMSVGETISAVVMASELRAAGIDAYAMTGFDAGICTDTVDGCATIDMIDTSLIETRIEAGQVPVVTGFQGIDPDGEMKTLGRGGSDTTACALAVALGASSVDIFKDVDGIASGDPRVIPEARLLERVTADELFQLASAGSRIIHAPAAELALSSGLLMRIRNTFSDAPGTDVVDMRTYRPTTVATGVTARTDIARFRIELPSMSESPHEHMWLQTAVYGAMAGASISIDMFTPLEEGLAFTVPLDRAQEASALIGELGCSFSMRDDIAKVSLVGSGMHGVPGVMARMARALLAQEINIIQAADSHTTISVLVDEARVVEAQRALHAGFGLGAGSGTIEDITPDHGRSHD